MSDLYVRLEPFNKKTGALARRVTAGGRLFEEGQWYVLPEVWAGKLKNLKQESGASYFQLMSKADFEGTARREMAAAMTAAGIHGLAMQGVQDFPKPNVQKQGPSPSAFEGLDAATNEVDLGAPIPVEVADAGAVTSEDVGPPSGLDSDSDADGDDSEESGSAGFDD